VEQDLQNVKDLGFFGQEEVLTFNERLMFTLGLRADRSSNNSDTDQWYFYPKSSLSFRIPLGGAAKVEELKLRGAIGQSGNQPKYGQKFTTLETGNIAGLPASVVFTETGAPDIRPERQREIEAGFDVTLANNLGNLEVTVYEKKITELLLTRTLAPTTGFQTQFFNSGSMRNRGVEVGLTLLPVRTENFNWTARGTFFTSRCKILDLGSYGGEPVPAFRPIAFLNGATFGQTFIEPGKSCTQLQGNAPDESEPTGRSVQTIADASPDYKVSLANDINWRGLRLYALVDRQKGGVLLNATGLLYDLVGNSPDQTEKDPDAVGIAKQFNGNERAAQFGVNTGLFLEDASYWKLREASVSFQVPSGMLQGFIPKARSLRVGLTGRNLITITPYRGGDPESNEIQRSAAEGVPWEIWPYPPSRSLWLNVDLGF
jgi:outer membrane receptor protein involved in Fe transport